MTAGQAGDSPQCIPVLAKVRVRLPDGCPRTTSGAVAASKAYSSRGNRAYLRKRGFKAVILKAWRGIATQCDKTQTATSPASTSAPQ